MPCSIVFIIQPELVLADVKFGGLDIIWWCVLCHCHHTHMQNIILFEWIFSLAGETVKSTHIPNPSLS